MRLETSNRLSSSHVPPTHTHHPQAEFVLKHGDVHKEKSKEPRNIEFFWKEKHLDVKSVADLKSEDKHHSLKSWFKAFTIVYPAPAKKVDPETYK